MEQWFFQYLYYVNAYQKSIKTFMGNVIELKNDISRKIRSYQLIDRDVNKLKHQMSNNSIS